VNAPPPHGMRKLRWVQKTMGQPLGGVSAGFRGRSPPHARDPSAGPVPVDGSRWQRGWIGGGKVLSWGPVSGLHCAPYRRFCSRPHLFRQSAREQLVLAGKHRLQAGLRRRDSQPAGGRQAMLPAGKLPLQALARRCGLTSGRSREITMSRVQAVPSPSRRAVGVRAASRSASGRQRQTFGGAFPPGRQLALSSAISASPQRLSPRL